MDTPCILLDIDGVMISAASWKPLELLPDGFYKFGKTPTQCLNRLLELTGANIVLTTTHRSRYTAEQWTAIFKSRFEYVQKVTPLDNSGAGGRLDEVQQWAQRYGAKRPYVIIDDDTRLERLPADIRAHWVKTQPLMGLNSDTAAKAVAILSSIKL